ncbi:ABC transporter permease [Falsirhodobacter sp. alg1]|uniref:ABC transporter permease n=1 Tax=Falsirhodobacter sp. alg1 TaxID=1472418 RepID=UPI000A78DC10|nr:ABC transporter permease [Falsirhodobacter sp. alg1]
MSSSNGLFGNRAIGLSLTLPAAIFAAALFLVPVAILLSEGFTGPEGGFSLGPYVDFFADPRYRAVFWRTLKLGALVTCVSAILGYIVAYAIVTLPSASRSKVFGLIILPLMISPVARTYAWLVILGRTGIVNDALGLFGIEPVRFLFTETAVFIGLLQLFMPLMIVSLLSAMENMPTDAVPAARMLGANWIQVFTRVIVPLTREGLVIGGTLVFTGSLTAYITPAILGGSKVLMLETLLYQRVTVGRDFASASVIAMILILVCFAANLGLRRLATVKKRAMK